MARQPRFVIPGIPQHVIQRGNNRSVIFVSNEDCQFYLDKLSEACVRYGCEIHSYVLMTNHVHFLMTPHNDQSISKVMQTLGRYYVQYFNYTYKRTGTLWEGRYKATILDSEPYLLTCYRYIELNPVRAGMVDHPSEYPWSSYRHNALNHENNLITPHELYESLGSNKKERSLAYKSLFKNHINEKTLDTLREATNKAWALGNDKFRDQIKSLTERQATPKNRGGNNRSKQSHVNI